MITKIKKFIGLRYEKKPITDFSGFFHDASSAERKKVLEQVVREANKDQRDLVEKYNRTKAA